MILSNDQDYESKAAIKKAEPFLALPLLFDNDISI